MAIIGDELRVNGAALSWGSLIAKADNERIEGWTSINYADKRERVKGTGMGPHQAPGRRSRGKYTVELVKVKGFKSSIAALRKYLANAAGGSSYGEYEFEFLLQGVEADETPIDVQIGRCCWSGDSSTHEENADLLQDEIEIDAMYIIRDGLTLFDGSQGSPSGA